MKLYHCLNARSFRCLWAIEEMGIKNCEVVTMPFPPRAFYKEYLKTNALGTIPYFLEGDNVKMTESSAICQYLAERHAPQLTIASHEADYSTYLNWMYHSDATLTFPQAVALRYTQLQPGRADAAAADYAQFHHGRLRMLDEVLLNENKEFLVGDRFTMADVCIAYSLFLGTAIEVNSKKMSELYKPQTLNYMERMMERPGFLAAQEVQEKSAAAFKP